jgi:hypothetical protein
MRGSCVARHALPRVCSAVHTYGQPVSPLLDVSFLCMLPFVAPPHHSRLSQDLIED